MLSPNLRINSRLVHLMITSWQYQEFLKRLFQLTEMQLGSSCLGRYCDKKFYIIFPLIVLFILTGRGNITGMPSGEVKNSRAAKKEKIKLGSHQRASVGFPGNVYGYCWEHNVALKIKVIICPSLCQTAVSDYSSTVLAILGIQCNLHKNNSPIVVGRVIFTDVVLSRPSWSAF